MTKWEHLVEQLKALLPECRVEVTRAPSPFFSPTLVRPPSGVIVYPPGSKPIGYGATARTKDPIYAVWAFIVGSCDHPKRNKNDKFFGWALFIGSNKNGNGMPGQYCMAKEVLDSKPGRKNTGLTYAELDAAAIAAQVRNDLFV